MDLLTAARALAAAGATIVQLRHKQPLTRDIYTMSRELAALLRAEGIPLVINDRADWALMVSADGVHVGQDDLPPDAVRRVAGERLFVGYSTHNEEQLRQGDREPVDYLAIGPIFGTKSKENPDPVVGLEELARLRRLTGKPLVAIGGITRENARSVLAAGADAVAVISDLVTGGIEARARQWLEVTSSDRIQRQADT